MASPLRWFRKHEKKLLVFFGVGLMFVFTLSIGSSGIDPIIDWFTGGGVQSGNSAPIVAEWNGGAVTESDMLRLRQNRNLVIQYLAAVQQQASMRGRTPQAEILPRMNNEESLVELAILQGEANKRGIVITDETVLNYLVQLSGGSMQPAEFLQLWQSMTRGRGTERQLNSLLRNELMAARLRGLVWSGTRAASPVAFWDYFNRLEKRIDAEMMAINVADFVSQVPEPTESELQDFFALYQDKHAEPGSPDPGFRQRRRLAFDYIRFDFEDFLEVEKLAVTDEEIAKYYADNKSDFIRTLPEDDLKFDATDDAKPSDGAPAKDADTSQAAAVSEDSTSDAARDQPEESVAEVAGEAGPKQEESEDETTAETSEPDSTATTGDEPADPSPTPVPQQTAAGEPAAGGPGDDAQRDNSLKKDTTHESGTEPTRSDETNSDETGTEGAGTEGDEMKTDESDTSEGSSAPAESPEDTPKTEVSKADEYRPLSEVADEIRRAIAAPRAQEKMSTAMRTVQSRMNRYYKQYVLFEIKAEQDDSIEPPEMPTLEDISQDPPLIISSVPLSDRFEISQFELGQAVEFEFLQERILRIPFAQIVYEERSLPAYQPRTFPAVEVSPRFIYWLVGQEADNQPDLEEIRDQVVEAWKMGKAADLALETAQRQATRAREANQSLSASLDYPNATTFQTGEISWLTSGNLPLDGSNALRFSEIPGVEMPSEELFRRMFRLQPGQVAVAMNRPRTVAFVIRASEPATPTAERSELYFASGINLPGLYPIMRSESQRLLNGWYDELTEGYQLTWKREPQPDVRLN